MNKIQENEKQKDYMNELSVLESRLAVTPETIWVSVPCGTDENGSTIYEEIENPNPEFIALLKKIEEISAKIS